MVKYIAALALFALVGIAVCALASQANAYSCTTFCTTIGDSQFCSTNCF